MKKSRFVDLVDELRKYRVLLARCSVLELYINGYQERLDRELQPDVEDTAANRQRIRDLRTAIDSCKHEMSQTDARAKRISNVLEALDSRERFVIEKYYIDGSWGWATVAQLFENQFGIPYTDRHLRRIGHKALEKMSRILSEQT